MKKGKTIRAIGLALVSGLIMTGAHATTVGGPATGLWANPADGGRGFNIDIQGNTMTVTTFVYKADGAPIWYLSSGIYNHKTGVFTSSYDSYSNGQCFGCPARSPDVHSGDAGPMRIEFRDNERATITTPAGRQQIQKFNYGFATPTDILYGVWAFTMNTGSLYTSDWVSFDAPYVSGGETYASGRTYDGRGNVALGQFVSSDIGTLVLVDSGSYYHAYQILLEDRRGIGFGWVYPKGGSPTGNGAVSVASRIMFKGEVNKSGAIGPSTQEQVGNLDADIARQTAGSERPDPQVESVFADMIRAMDERLAE